jgi:hypothetical protein
MAEVTRHGVEIVMAKPTPEILSDDYECPYCVEEGVAPKREYCKRHRWAYRSWYEQWQEGLSN